MELYRHATALVFPSRYEGFGLPVLEAMARRTPVIASNSSSIPEVARGAAILVDPDDVEGLRDAMRRVAQSPALRAELTGAAPRCVAGFSWDETARATVAAYEELSTVALIAACERAHRVLGRAAGQLSVRLIEVVAPEHSHRGGERAHRMARRQEPAAGCGRRARGRAGSASRARRRPGG